MAQKIKALIEKYASQDDSDRLAGQKEYSRGKPKCLAVFSIVNPGRNYDGAKMFEVAVMPTKVVKLFRRFIKAYPDASTHFYAGRDYTPNAGEFKIKYSEDPIVIKGWERSHIIPDSGIDVITILSGCVIETYCALMDVEVNEVIEYDELIESSWDKALGILEKLVSSTDQP